MKDLKLIHKNLIKYNSFSHAISQIPKIVLETILVCFIIITSILMYRFESDYLITTLSFFGIFGYKIFPNISHSYSYFTIIRSGINSFEYLKKDLILYFESSENKTYNYNEKFDKIESIKIDIKKSFYFDENKILEPQIINFYPNKLNIISGESGGGKSTVINLLMGFILDQNVKININGLQIDKKIYPSLQSTIGYVPQKFELIDDSIENNIKLGRDYSKEEYEKTINICSLNEFVGKFSHRENINIGENNEGISGGQAQRISIARAIIKKPKILILDEGTGQLDR